MKSRNRILTSTVLLAMFAAFAVGCDDDPDVAPCPTAQVTCSGTCVNTTTDPANCGACGTACAKGEVCAAGKCGMDCLSTQTKCGGGDAGALFCANTQSDNKNCGACGNACAKGKVCTAGKCGMDCLSTQTKCGGGDAGALFCANTQSDNKNCGTCDNACKVGDTCVKGTCTLTCLSTQTKCSGGASKPSFCANTQSDNSHCGACGNACKNGEACVAGKCSVKCLAGDTNCKGKCVDTLLDAKNCGACATACKAGEVCSAGKCGLSCAGGSTKCAGKCVDTLLDPSNCGACATACPSGEVCSAGKCGLTCVGGSTECSGKCADTQNDPANCGTCGTACVTGTYCSGGKCVCFDKTKTSCSGSCVDTQTDVTNCGTCGNKCAGGQQCKAGVCKENPCDSGTLALVSGQIPASGTVRLTLSGAKATATFQSTSTFGPGATSGYVRAAIPKAGFVPVKDTSASNWLPGPYNPGFRCGTTGAYFWAKPPDFGYNNGAFWVYDKTKVTVPKGTTCTWTVAPNAACGCATGQSACSGACVKTQTDVNNCGTCGTVCKTGQQCIAGKCQANPCKTTGWLAAGGSSERTDDLYDVVTDSSGNVYIGGWVDGAIKFGGVTATDPNSSSTTSQPTPFVAKLDSTGAWKWVTQFYQSDLNGFVNGDHQGSVRAIKVDASGNVHVAGYKQIAGSGTLRKGRYPFVAKLDSSGKVLWEKIVGDNTSYGKGPYGHAYALDLDSSGNVYIAGDYRYSMKLGSTTLTYSGGGYAHDGFVAKLSSSGAWVWAATGGGANSNSYFSEAIRGIAVDSATGRVYVAGKGEFGPFGTHAWKPGVKISSFYAMLDSSGKWGWVKSPTVTSGITSQSARFGHAIAHDGKGNVIVSGIFSGKATTDKITFGTKALAVTKANTDHVYVARADKDGNWLWAKSLAPTSGKFSLLGSYATPGGGAWILGEMATGTYTLGPVTLDRTKGQHYALEISSAGAWTYGFTANMSHVRDIASFGNGAVYIASRYYSGSATGMIKMGTFSVAKPFAKAGDYDHAVWRTNPCGK